jgi:hypothetical protein
MKKRDPTTWGRGPEGTEASAAQRWSPARGTEALRAVRTALIPLRASMAEPDYATAPPFVPPQRIAPGAQDHHRNGGARLFRVRHDSFLFRLTVHVNAAHQDRRNRKYDSPSTRRVSEACENAVYLAARLRQSTVCPDRRETHRRLVLTSPGRGAKSNARPAN